MNNTFDDYYIIMDFFFHFGDNKTLQHQAFLVFFIQVTLKLVSHHSILSPVRQAVVHCDLLPLGDVSDCYDNQPYLGPAVDFSNTAVWRWMEEHRSPNTTRSLLPQLWHTGKHKLTLATWIPNLKPKSEQNYCRGSSLPELSGIRQVVGTARGREAVFCTLRILAITWDRVQCLNLAYFNCFITNYMPYVLMIL